MVACDLNRALNLTQIILLVTEVGLWLADLVHNHIIEQTSHSMIQSKPLPSIAKLSTKMAAFIPCYIFIYNVTIIVHKHLSLNFNDNNIFPIIHRQAPVSF